jgi:hypothetical protein
MTKIYKIKRIVGIMWRRKSKSKKRGVASIYIYIYIYIVAPGFNPV